MRRLLLTSLAATICAGGPPALAQDDARPTLSVVVSETFGPHLVGLDRRPVYAMLTDLETGDGEQPLQSCGAGCRERWPVLTVAEDVGVADGLDPALAEAILWRGHRVASYGGHPLFLFNRDKAGEEPVGQGIFSFGGYWALVTPDGSTIRSDAMPD